MHIINPRGDLVFMGVMEENPSSRHSSVEVAKNYVRGVLEDMAADPTSPRQVPARMIAR